MQNKLKPCPFCGGAGSIEKVSDKYPNYVIRCAGCRITTAWYSDKKALLYAWNRRANSWTPVSERLPEERFYPPVICGHDKDDWTDAAIVNKAGCFINSEGLLHSGTRLDNGATETGYLVITFAGTSREEYFISDKFTGYLTQVDPKSIRRLSDEK